MGKAPAWQGREGAGQGRAWPGLRQPLLPRTRHRRDTGPAAPRAPGGPRDTDGACRGTNCRGARRVAEQRQSGRWRAARAWPSSWWRVREDPEPVRVASAAAGPCAGTRAGQPRRRRHLESGAESRARQPRCGRTLYREPGAGRGSSPCLQQSPLCGPTPCPCPRLSGSRVRTARRPGGSRASDPPHPVGEASVPPGVASSAPWTLARESVSPAELPFLSWLTLNDI